MEYNKALLFLSVHGDKFPKTRIAQIRDILLEINDDQLPVLMNFEFKNPSAIFTISISFGVLGFDRFALDDTGMGVLKLLTCGGCYIWWIVDIFNAMERTREYNLRRFLEITRVGISY